MRWRKWKAEWESSQLAATLRMVIARNNGVWKRDLGDIWWEYAQGWMRPLFLKSMMFWFFSAVAIMHEYHKCIHVTTPQICHYSISDTLGIWHWIVFSAVVISWIVSSWVSSRVQANQMFSLTRQNLKRRRLNLSLAFCHWQDSDLFISVGPFRVKQEALTSFY